MNIIEIFKYSVLLPNKKALFRLNRIGMKMIVTYVFILMLIAASPPLTTFIFTGRLPAENDIPPTLFILQFFFFYYLLVVFIGFLGISAIAYIGLWLRKWLQRKLAYQQLWKMSAFAATVPLLLYTLAETLAINHWTVVITFLIVWLAIITKMITAFPRRNEKL